MKLYTSTEKLDADSEYLIQNCAFYKCSSVETGGAISAPDIPKTAAFDIQGSGFYDCSADKGGAFYVTCGKVEVSESCFSLCKSLSSDSAFKSVSNEGIFTNLYIDQSSGKHVSSIDSPSSISMKKVNFTLNKDELTMLAISKSKKSSLLFANFDRNDAKTILYIKGSDESDTFQYVNFVNNFASTSIEIGSNMILRDIYFIRERSKLFININSHVIQIIGFYFSGSSSDADKAFSQIVISNGKYDVISTYDVKISPSEKCWLLMPNNNGGNDASSNYKVFLILAFILIIVVAVLIIYYVKRNRYGISGERLAYTL